MCKKSVTARYLKRNISISKIKWMGTMENFFLGQIKYILYFCRRYSTTTGIYINLCFGAKPAEEGAYFWSLNSTKVD